MKLRIRLKGGKGRGRGNRFAKGQPKGYKPGQSELNGLRRAGVQVGEAINLTKAKTIKRNRVKLEEKKAVALEAHELQQMARENATLAMETLIEISKSKRSPETTRIAASAVILDRAYGKASQTSITARVTDGKTSEIDGNELDTRIASTLKRVEALTRRTPKAPSSEERPSRLRLYN